MNWVRDNRRETLFIALTLVLPCVLLLWLLLSLLGMRSDYQAEIDRLEPRIARLIGLDQFAPELAAAAGRVDSDVLALVYPSTEDKGAVSTSLQKNVRDVFTAAGMNITGSQIMPSRTEDGLEYIPVKITAMGLLDDLDAALDDLHRYRPVLMVESMDVYPSRRGARRGEKDLQQITVTMQILALRQVE